MALEFQSDFKKKEFLKNQPPMRRCAAFSKVGKNFARGRKMNFVECAPAVHQSQATAEGAGQAIRDFGAQVLKCHVNHAPEPARCEFAVGRGFIDGDNTTDFERFDALW